MAGERRKPLREFHYARSLKYGRKGQVNIFEYRGERLKTYLSPDGRTLQILDAPKSVVPYLKIATDIHPYRNRLRLQLRNLKPKPEPQPKTKTINLDRRLKSVELSIQGFASKVESYFTQYQIFNKDSSFDDTEIVRKQIPYVEHISRFFNPLSYHPVQTILVNESTMDQVSPPEKIEQVEREVQRIKEQAEQADKPEWEFIEIKNLKRRLYELVAMGCFTHTHFRVDAGTLHVSLLPEPTVYLCPERIRRCIDNMRSILSNRKQFETLKSLNSYKSDDANFVYRFVTIHEHAHAATLTGSVSMKSQVNQTMCEGVAQWITHKILRENSDLTTLTLFETHANTVTKEYRFYTHLNTLESTFGPESITSAILCWSRTQTFYDWTKFVKDAEKGAFTLSVL